MSQPSAGRGVGRAGAPGGPLGAAAGALVRLLDRWVFRTVEWLAVACLAGVALLSFYQVVSRFLFDAPLSWSEVLTRALMVFAVFLGAARLFREGALIAVDLAYTTAGPRFRRLLDWLHFLCAMTFLAVACFFGFELAWRVRFQVMAGIGVPISYAYLAVPIGALLCALAVLAARLERR